MSTTPREYRRPSLNDVAKEAGVSVMTASNVVNNKPIVKQGTRRRVLEAIDKLGYVPTQAGRSLRTNKQWAIGFVLIDASGRFLTDPPNAAILAGVSQRLTLAGYSLIVELGQSFELSSVSGFRRRLVDALIICSSGNAVALEKLDRATAKLGIKRIFAQTHHRSDTYSSIALADFDGGAMLADHLAARAVKSVLIVETTLAWSAFEERKRGIIEGFKVLKTGTQVATLQSISEGYEDTYAATLGYLKRSPPVDAIIGLNDHMAIAAMHAAQTLGHRIPDDIKVAGFNGADITKYVQPKLTTVYGSAFDLGLKAAEISLSTETKHERLAVTLQRGETT